MAFATLHDLLADALLEYEDWLLSSAWRGKEHECVNLFLHRFVYARIHPGGPLSDFTQVAIEVGVPQPSSIGIKQACRKDLVIWETPAATTWDAEWKAVRYPRAIMEWKARRRRTRQSALSPYDIEWLRQYSLMLPEFTGSARRLTLPRQPGESPRRGSSKGSWRRIFIESKPCPCRSRVQPAGRGSLAAMESGVKGSEVPSLG